MRYFIFSRSGSHSGLRPEGYICQGGWGIHTVNGCVHRCDYCGLGSVVILQLDVERAAEQAARTFARYPEQKLYRYDLTSDIPCFEPEYDAVRVLSRTFAEWDKYLLIYTKSDNVDWLLDMPYREHRPFYCTLSMDSVASRIERGTPSLTERIEGLRKCAESGYTVRVGFSPVIPVAGWREETTRMLEALFAACKPDVVRAWVLSMMDADEFSGMFDLEEMDPHCVRRMLEDKERMDGTHKAPFPSDVRGDIYEYYIEEVRRLSPETPFALCTEDPDIWDRLEDRLAMTRDRMFCCCGGTSVPGTFQGSPQR